MDGDGSPQADMSSRQTQRGPVCMDIAQCLNESHTAHVISAQYQSDRATEDLCQCVQDYVIAAALAVRAHRCSAINLTYVRGFITESYVISSASCFMHFTEF